MTFNLMNAQARKERLTDPHVRAAHDVTDRDALVADLTKCAARATAAREQRDRTEVKFKTKVLMAQVAERLEEAARAKLELFDSMGGQ